jgi:hypothetical protein
VGKETEIEKLIYEGDYIYAVVDGLLYEDDYISDIIMPHQLYLSHGWSSNDADYIPSLYKEFLLHEYIFEEVEMLDPVTQQPILRPNSGLFKKYRIIDYYYNTSNYSIGSPNNINNNNDYKSEMFFNIVIEVADDQGHVFKISPYRDVMFLPYQILTYIFSNQLKKNIINKQNRNTIDLLKAIQEQNNKQINTGVFETIFKYLQKGDKLFKNLHTNTPSKRYRTRKNRKPGNKVQSSKLVNYNNNQGKISRSLRKKRKNN